MGVNEEYIQHERKNNVVIKKLHVLGCHDIVETSRAYRGGNGKPERLSWFLSPPIRDLDDETLLPGSFAVTTDKELARRETI